MPQANPIFSTINGVTISGTPTLGQVPTAVSGTYATWQTPAGGSSTPRISFSFPYIQHLTGNTGFSTAGTFTGGQSSGYAQVKQGGGGSASSYGYYQQNSGVGAFQSNAGMKNMSGSFLGYTNSFSSETGTAWIKWFSDTVASSLNTVTGNHIGIKDVISAASSVTSSTVGNGTSGTTTTLASSAIFQQLRLITWKQPTVTNGDVTFYVDAASKNVHSTNQPAIQSASQLMGAYITENGAGTAVGIYYQQFELQGDLF